MPASPRAFEALAVLLRCAVDPGSVDMLLDRWLDYRDRATEWDAQRWGFNPDRWMERERAELFRRARLHLGDSPAHNEGMTL